MLDVKKAKKELEEKSLNQIQESTAWTWASRAAASYENAVEATGDRKLINWSLGEEYAHEALEHAALVDGKDLLTEVKTALEPYQDKASEELGKLFENKDNLKEKSE